MQSADRNYSVPPFPAFPSITRFVPLGSVQEAIERVCRSVDARDAISLVIGPPGTGKSLICGLLVDRFRSSHDVVVLGETAIDSREAFQRHLLHHLGADFNCIAEGGLQLALIDRVCSDEAPEGGLLIVVDEAQSLPSEVLEAIRMATNIMRDGEPRVLAVLCGGVKLDETLVDTSMEAFTQRVATRCYLHPMNGEETRRYVAETIRMCGSDPDQTVTDEAIAAVHHACCGVPRLMNQMLTQAIDCAEEAEQTLITEQIIDQAWAQLQQLPSPMLEEPKISHKIPPIEFGELDESVNFAEWIPEHQAANQAAGVDQGSLQSDPCEPNHCETGESAIGSCQPAAAQFESDIEFESSTANWVEEPAAPMPPAPIQVSPAALFGHFEQEEEVPVGNAFARPQPSMPPTNLEAMLHQEIVNITTLDATSAPINAVSLTSEESENHKFLAEPEEQIQDFINVNDDDADCQDSEDQDAVLRMPEVESDVTQCKLTIHDDSDILVIEDELELRKIDPSSRVDSQEKTISVDFQAMLSRMQIGR